MGQPLNSFKEHFVRDNSNFLGNIRPENDRFRSVANDLSDPPVAELATPPG